MEVVFIAAWCVAASAFFYGGYFWYSRLGYDDSERPPGHMRKALTGFGVFVAAVAVGFVAGGIAEVFGGGWR